MNPGVVHQNGWRGACFLRRGLHQTIRRSVFGHIVLHVAGCADQRGDRFLQFFLPSPYQNHARARSHEAARDAKTDAGCTAGDDRDFFAK